MGQLSIAIEKRRAKMRLKAAYLINVADAQEIPAFDNLDPNECKNLKPHYLDSFKKAYDELRSARLQGCQIVIDENESGPFAFCDKKVVIIRPEIDPSARIHLLLDLFVPYQEHATLHCEFEELIDLWIFRHGNRLGKFIAYLQCFYTILAIHSRMLRAILSNLLKSD